MLDRKAVGRIPEWGTTEEVLILRQKADIVHKGASGYSKTRPNIIWYAMLCYVSYTHEYLLRGVAT